MTCRIYSEDFYYDNVEETLGPLSASNKLFKNKFFLLTCSVLNHRNKNNAHHKKKAAIANGNGTPDTVNGNGSASAVSSAKQNTFTNVPFVMDHLREQLRSGGATVYDHFEDIPKLKHKSCILIAAGPCLTARYVQCLAVNMQVISNEWVVDCCRENRLLDMKGYALPSGWSILEDRYIPYWPGRGTEPQQRGSASPLINRTILISSENDDFIKFWSRVCKFAGAKTKPIKSVMDISANKRSLLLTDSEILAANIEKAKAVNVPIVSTVWVIECLVLGKLCAPDAHENLTKTNWDFHS